MKKTTVEPSGKAVSRERLNELMNAMVFIIVRRQMKRYWAPVQPVTLSSDI